MEYIKNNKIIQWTLRLIGVIILGAIGSGVWQIIGDPLLSIITKTFIDAINFITNTYKDGIYIEAARGLHENPATKLYILVFTFPPILALVFILSKKSAKKDMVKLEVESQSKHDEKTEQLEFQIESLNKQIKSGERVIFFSVIILIMTSIHSTTQTSYTNKVITYVDNTLDRLAPYESHENIIMLRAEFREVYTAEDYYKLYNKLESKLKAHDLPSRSQEPI
jgi:hypothetical protein